MILAMDDMAMKDVLELPDNSIEMILNLMIPVNTENMNQHTSAVILGESQLSLQGHYRSSI